MNRLLLPAAWLAISSWAMLAGAQTGPTCFGHEPTIVGNRR